MSWNTQQSINMWKECLKSADNLLKESAKRYSVKYKSDFKKDEISTEQFELAIILFDKMIGAKYLK